MRGFTLVDACFTVAAIGLLAFITAPQLSRASESSIIEKLDQQLLVASEAIRLYREFESERPVVSATEEGWGNLLEAELIDTQFPNAYTGSPALVEGTALDAQSIGPHSGFGYVYQQEPGVLFAVGFDQVNRKLFHQPGYVGNTNVRGPHNLR
ncbi:MAG: hypothetical protein AAGB34_02285 [Planctomycetota bacterium]